MIGAVGKRLIGKPVGLEVEQKSVLILPKKKDEVTVQIIAIGGEVDKNIIVNDFAFIPNDGGYPIEIFGETYLSITENQILATWRAE